MKELAIEYNEESHFQYAERIPAVEEVLYANFTIRRSRSVAIDARNVAYARLPYYHGTMNTTCQPKIKWSANSAVRTGAMPMCAVLASPRGVRRVYIVAPLKIGFQSPNLIRKATLGYILCNFVTTVSNLISNEGISMKWILNDQVSIPSATHDGGHRAPCSRGVPARAQLPRAGSCTWPEVLLILSGCHVGVGSRPPISKTFRCKASSMCNRHADASRCLERHISRMAVGLPVTGVTGG